MRLSLGSIGALLLTQAAFALTPATLVGPDLARQRVNIQSLRNGRLTYFDSNRDLRTGDLQNFAQIRDLPGSKGLAQTNAQTDAQRNAQTDAQKTRPDSAPQQVLELTDGQRLIGSWQGAAGNGQTLRWRHPLLGSVAIDLEQVAAIGLSTDPPHLGPLTSDTLWLANGDTVDGVLASLRDDAIEWYAAGRGDQTQMLVLPLSRVRAVRLATAPPAQPTGHLIWTRDGSRLRATNLRLASALMMQPTLVPAPASDDPGPGHLVQLPLAQVVRIDLASTRGRLLDLTTIEMRVTDGGYVFEVPMPSRVEASSIRMHAPVTVRFDLPQGTSRFAAVAELDLDVEQRLQGWANMDLIVKSEDQIVARHRLSASHPRVEVNVAIGGKSLIIEVAEAMNGPVMDRLRLRDPVLYVRSPLGSD